MQTAETEYSLSRDPLKSYLQQAGSTKLLTAEQERELAERSRRGDEEAREQLICSNLRLVISIAKKYAKGTTSLTLQDLIQEGNCGLIRAADGFDPSLGNRFSSYAIWWIKQAVLRAITERDRMVRLPVYTSEKLRKIQQAIQLSYQKNQVEELDYDYLSAQTGIEKASIEKLLHLARRTVSLDMLVGEHETSPLGEFIASRTAPSPEEWMDERSVHSTLAGLLDTLKPREKSILELRFGWKDDRIYTLEEVGRQFGVTRERVRQIEREALQKLRETAVREQLNELF